MWLMIIGVRGVNDAYMQANAEAQRKFKGEQIARGHMNPCAINSFDTKFMKATFTFANAVPQFQTSDRKSTRLNSSHVALSRMPSSA